MADRYPYPTLSENNPDLWIMHINRTQARMIIRGLYFVERDLEKSVVTDLVPGYTKQALNWVEKTRGELKRFASEVPEKRAQAR